MNSFTGWAKGLERLFVWSGLCAVRLVSLLDARTARSFFKRLVAERASGSDPDAATQPDRNWHGLVMPSVGGMIRVVTARGA